MNRTAGNPLYKQNIRIILRYRKCVKNLAIRGRDRNCLPGTVLPPYSLRKESKVVQTKKQL